MDGQEYFMLGKAPKIVTEIVFVPLVHVSSGDRQRESLQLSWLGQQHSE